MNFLIGLSNLAKDRLELGSMLLDAVSALGFAPRLVDAGDPESRNADVLLMVGDSRDLDGFVKRMAEAGGSRPQTILWQYDPMVPVGLGEAARLMGVRAIRAAAFFDEVHASRAGQGGLLSAIVPRNLFRFLGRTTYRILAARLPREIARATSCASADVDHTTSKNMMQRYVWLQDNVPRGFIDHVFGTTRAKTDSMRAMNIPASFVPFGYHPLMGTDLESKRDIDVVFLGRIRKRPRRRDVLSGVREALGQRGIEVVVRDRDCYGSERNALLNRAKICLNVAKYPWELPGMRFLICMGCRVLVVSEPMDNTEPYLPGEHFVQCPIDRLPETIEHYLRNEEERLRIVDAAAEFVRSELTLTASVKRILDHCKIESV